MWPRAQVLKDYFANAAVPSREIMVGIAIALAEKRVKRNGT